MPSKARALPITLAFTAAGLFALAFWAQAGWPGTPKVCWETMDPTCFCERLRPAGMAQPANTLSNLGFVIAGLAIAFTVDRRAWFVLPRRNLLTQTRFHPILFAVVTALLGPASMALHASMTEAGQLIDVASMYLYSSLLLAYSTARLRSLDSATTLALFLGSFALVTGIQALGWIRVEPTFGAMVVSVFAIEYAIRRRHPELVRDTRWILIAAGLFLTAFAIWVPSLSGGPLCDPESALQGHAIWHLLCAAAAASVFVYYQSEDTRASS